MKTFWINLLIITLWVSISACSESQQNVSANSEEHDSHSEVLMLSGSKLNDLDLNIGKIEQQTVYSTVQANGKLSVPPQNSALITGVVEANIQDIRVLEGEKVKKGQVLAYITHPNLIKMQSDFLQKQQQLNLLKSEYERKKKMFDENAVSGKSLQEAETQYKKMLAEVNGLEKQLEQIHININQLKQGNITANIPVISPISGFVERIYVQIGQFVSAQMPMFSVLNNHHLHADLMVYESDAGKVKIGQKVWFHTQTNPQKRIAAHIIAVGKTFEKDPKAIHVHADIDNHHDAEGLISGMFIEGEILTDSSTAFVLPESAVIVDNNRFYAFAAKKHKEQWEFKKIALPGVVKKGAFYVFNDSPPEGLFVRNNAYYIISEMEKDEMAHED